MNGAESLVHTLIAAGVDTCFANPGTSEMHFVSALDRIAGMRCVLSLAEGVVTGAADGYGRMALKPAATLLHCGPGLANGLSNLHNARRANTPIVNIVGDQATYHRPYDASLTADTEGWARPASAWTRTATSSETIASDAALAVQAARTSPGQIATLIAPSDTCWDEGGKIAQLLSAPEPSKADEGTVAAIARIISSGERCVLFVGESATMERPLEIAARITEKIGTKVIVPSANRRIQRGAGRAMVARLPHNPVAALDMLDGVRHMILVGTKPPVAMFAYPGKRGLLFPENCMMHVLTRPEQDHQDALERLGDLLKANKKAPSVTSQKIVPAKGAVTPEAVAQTLTALLPDQAIIVDESVSFGRSFFASTTHAPPHDWLQITGGAIGCGLPMALGAAVAAPDRRVVNLQADGSAMYSVQALWTQAREKLNVTTIILANRKYAILLGELKNVGAQAGRTAIDMMELDRPAIDWLQIAGGLGVEAARAETMEDFAGLFEVANRASGPFLIELVI